MSADFGRTTTVAPFSGWSGVFGRLPSSYTRPVTPPVAPEAAAARYASVLVAMAGTGALAAAARANSPTARARVLTVWARPPGSPVGSATGCGPTATDRARP